MRYVQIDNIFEIFYFLFFKNEFFIFYKQKQIKKLSLFIKLQTLIIFIDRLLYNHLYCTNLCIYFDL